MLRAALHAFALFAALIAVVTFAPHQANAQATDPTAPLPRPGAKAAAGAAAAAETKPPHVSWGFIEAGYGYLNEDGDDSQGPRFGFSMRAFKYAHLNGDFAWFGEDAKPDLFVGVGGHYSILPQTDMFLDVGGAY